MPKQKPHSIDNWRENKSSFPNPFPYIRDSKNYFSKKYFRYDFQAGLNLALLGIPQSISYAAIADLPVIYGVFTALICSFISPFFSSSGNLSFGATNATAVLLSTFLVGGSISTSDLSLIVLMVGVFCILGAFLKVAELSQFISRSTLTAYLLIAAIFIGLKQLQHVFGVSEQIGIANSNLFGLSYQLLKSLPHFQWATLLIASFSAACYLLMQRKFPRLPNFSNTLFVSCLLVFFLNHFFPSLRLGNLDYFNNFHLRELKINLPNLGNIEVWSRIGELSNIALAIAFLATIETIGMGKSLAAKRGQPVCPNQTLLSLGINNLFCGLGPGMISSGSLTRSTLSYESKAKTQISSVLSGLFSLIFVWLILSFSLLDQLPKASLAGLLVAVSIVMIKKRSIQICLNTTKDDFWVFIVTCSSALFLPIYTSILLGTGLSFILFLRRVSHPYLAEFGIDDSGKIRELKHESIRPNPNISIIHVEGSLFFGAAELFRQQIERLSVNPNLKVILLQLRNARDIDATAAFALHELIDFMHKKNCYLLLCGVTEITQKCLERSWVLPELEKDCDSSKGETNWFSHQMKNPNLSTREALRRAQELIGNEHTAEVEVVSRLD